MSSSARHEPLCRRWVVWGLGGVVVWVVGHAVSGIYGLDPPYWVFWAGFGMQLLALPVGLVALWLAVAKLLRAFRG